MKIIKRSNLAIALTLAIKGLEERDAGRSALAEGFREVLKGLKNEEYVEVVE